MTIPAFAFNPVNGFEDAASYPNPTSEAAARTQVQGPLNQIRDYINDEIKDVLNSTTDGSSGGDNVAMTAISVLGAAATVQSIAEALVTRIQSVADEASGADLCGVTPISVLGASATMQSLIEALVTRLQATTDEASGADLCGVTPISVLGASATMQSLIEALVTRLQATTDEASGADLCGVTPISVLGTSATVQSIIEVLVTRLRSITDGASGADLCGATPISSSPSNIQGILEWLHTQIITTTLGQIPDGSISEVKLSFTVATQTELDDLAGAGRTTETVKVNADAITTLNNKFINQKRKLRMGVRV